MPKGVRIPQEIKDRMVEAYVSGHSQDKASAKFGLTRLALLNELKRRGIPTREYTGHLDAGQAQTIRDRMVEAWQRGDPVNQILAIFGYSDSVLYDELARRGIATGRTARKHKLDESFFDIISTEEKAYALGFITADGTIYPPSVIISLGWEDRKHLEKFQHIFQCSYPINKREFQRRGKIYTSAVLRVHSAQWVKALRCCGVIENKSLVISPCATVPNHLLRHYWRGVFDGDGCVARGKVWFFTLAGSEAICEGFREFIGRYVQSRATVRPNNTVCQIAFGGIAMARKVAEVLYSGATIYLDRKYQLAMEAMATPDCPNKYDNYSDNYLLGLLREEGSWRKVRDRLGIPKSSLYKLVADRGLWQSTA